MENLSFGLNLIPASKQLHKNGNKKSEDFAKFGLEVPTAEWDTKRQHEKEFTRYFGYILCECTVHAKNVSKLCLVESWKSESEVLEVLTYHSR